MSVKTPSPGRAARQLAVLAIAVTATFLLAGFIETAWAQGSPFGASRTGSATAAPVAGFAGWVLAKQAEFYRQFTGLIRSAKTDGGAAWDLLGVSFLYGIFHAAGPGHGKAVISSYMVANRETWIRGVVLSFASALLQALVAIAVVGVAAAILNDRATTMNGAINMIETAGYVLIVAIGLRLLWVKGRNFLGLLHQIGDPVPALEGQRAGKEAGRTEMAGRKGHGHVIQTDRGRVHFPCGHDHAHHGHGHFHVEHDHSSHDGDCDCGHAHSPPPQKLAGAGGWRRGLTAIVATGSRPCSGAILVLVFAMAQGLFWLGAGATLAMGLGTFLTVATIATIAVMARATASRLAAERPRYGVLLVRGIEVGAAAVITLFGVMLLCGYMANERMIGL